MEIVIWVWLEGLFWLAARGLKIVLYYTTVIAVSITVIKRKAIQRIYQRARGFKRGRYETSNLFLLAIKFLRIKMKPIYLSLPWGFAVFSTVLYAAHKLVILTVLRPNKLTEFDADPS